MISWNDSAWCSSSEIRPKPIAPAMAPRTEPMPPTTTMVRIRMVVWKPRLSGVDDEVKSVYMPPATPAKAADSTKAVDFHRARVHAHGHGRHVALAHRAEGRAQPRARQRHREPQHGRRDDHHEGIRLQVVHQLQAAQRRRLHLHAVGAVGHRLPVQEHPLHRLAEGEGGEREVDVAHAQRQQPDDPAQRGRQQRAREDGHEERRLPLVVDEPGGVDADAEEGRMRERELPRLADDQVHAEREHGEHHQQVDHVQHVAAGGEGQHREHERHGQQHRAVAPGGGRGRSRRRVHTFFTCGLPPSRPCGAPAAPP
ncbi:hypothetical protein DdX_21780 [Ditylenchus destructor]|uniref:Uncharacterized protein n=1 Tax=Ditylenchus destructor TaxID=166010 RepID=A0AAD4MFV6_9BILA|nr:hypothetical protein DdX_21780 [Ditylenchus destructor]